MCGSQDVSSNRAGTWGIVKRTGLQTRDWRQWKTKQQSNRRARKIEGPSFGRVEMNNRSYGSEICLRHWPVHTSRPAQTPTTRYVQKRRLILGGHGNGIPFKGGRYTPVQVTPLIRQMKAQSSRVYSRQPLSPHVASSSF
jgi:hypothetical protein